MRRNSAFAGLRGSIACHTKISPRKGPLLSHPHSNGFAIRMPALRFLLLCLAIPAACMGKEINFEAEIASLLESRCVSCHNADQANGDIRLDDAEQVASTISLDDPDSSLLIEQVSGAEPLMPKDGKPLSQSEITALRKWIASGAPWPEGRTLQDKPLRDLNWWSLKPIKVSSLPDGLHPIDAFIDAKLHEAGLTPVSEADSLTLIRRLAFDLTGLPPTPEQITEFQAACTDTLNFTAAYEKLVDQLLSSPEFGEHWARHWLDIARYGETHGYDKDQPRLNAWPYRDYVIRSFNDDKPYDRFVKEQIAGDALFPNEPDGILGLGFLAAGPWDLIGHVEVGEGKIDGRIAKHLDRDEMISAVFNVFTSTTVQCAQCHHHKFDPVRMEDYYRLHAVFSAVDRAERIYQALPFQQEEQRSLILAQINDIQAKRDAIERPLLHELTQKTSDIDRRVTDLKRNQVEGPKPAFGWHSEIASTADALKWVQVDLGAAREISSIKLSPAYDDFAGIGAGFGFPPKYRVEVSNDLDFKQDVRQVYANTKPELIGHSVLINVQTTPFRYIRVTATELAVRQNDFIFALAELQAFDGELDSTGNQTNHAYRAAVTSLDSIESGERWSRKNLTDGIFFQELRSDAEMETLARLRTERAAIESALRTQQITNALAQLERTLQELKQQLSRFPAGATVYAASTQFTTQGQFTATNGNKRPIHLLVRGDVRNHSRLVLPGMPPLWPGAKENFELPDSAPEYQSRAELANAITDPHNPIFWRSIVNRLWQWTFHQAIVETPNDFGRMGMLPTHPELLDWLAAKLRDDPKHSLKSIVRLLVTSQAYRRSSSHDAANAELDAGNRLLWRANRKRLSAEEIRDAILLVSGKLRREDRGGPSFQDFVIEKPEHSPHYEYDKLSPEDPRTHRRSIYRFVVRSQPQPFLTSLDCADPSLSVAAREESTTAIQALTLWNSRFSETFARAFAEQIEMQTSAEEKVSFTIRTALGRPPTESEAKLLTEHLRAHGPASLARIVFNLNAFLYVD